MRHNVKYEIQMEFNLQTEKTNLTLQWFQHVHNQNADDPLLHRDMLLTVYSTGAQQFQWFLASKDPDETETIFKVWNIGWYYENYANFASFWMPSTRIYWSFGSIQIQLIKNCFITVFQVMQVYSFDGKIHDAWPEGLQVQQGLWNLKHFRYIRAQNIPPTV